MSNSSKVYVIDPRTGKSGRGAVKGSERVEYTPERTGVSGSGAEGSRDRKAAKLNSENRGTRGRRKDSPVLSLFSYFLGPMAVLATRRSSKSKIMIVVAAASAILSVAAIWMWGAIFSGPATGSFADGVWIFMGCLAVMTALSTWSASVALLAKERAAALRRLPDLLARPYITGLLGLIAPGLGLYVNGYSRRAAIALWMSGTAVLSILLLLHSRWLWQWNEATGAVAMEPITLEYIFIALGSMAVLGVLAWIVQVLDGMRLAGSSSSRRARTHGDLLAILLLGVIVAFVFSSQPAYFAQRLDEFAVSAYTEGFKIIPLKAVKAAAALDASKPLYVLHAVSVYEDLGMDEEARALRMELWNNWEPCVEGFEAEGRMERNDAPAAPLGTFVEQGAPALDESTETEPIETGRLAIWDRVDALCGPLEIESTAISMSSR